jgi:hypothetical protein
MLQQRSQKNGTTSRSRSCRQTAQVSGNTRCTAERNTCPAAMKRDDHPVDMTVRIGELAITF